MFLLNFLFSVIKKSTVLIFGTTGEIITEKAGHLNLGIPGIMFFGALGGCIGGSFCLSLSITSGLLIVLITCVFAFVFACFLGAIYSFLTVTLRANQNITGLTITTLGTGCFKLFVKFLDAAALGKLNIVFDTFFLVEKNGPLFYIAIVVAIISSIVLTKTKIGLHLRAVGENPATADAAGINVSAYKYFATMIGSGVAGLGGLSYVFYLTGASVDVANSAIDFYGWLSIALVIFVSWKPALSIVGALVFTILSTASTYLPISNLKSILDMAPYIMTIVILIITSIIDSKENQPPASLGVNYFREDR